MKNKTTAVPAAPRAPRNRKIIEGVGPVPNPAPYSITFKPRAFEPMGWFRKTLWRIRRALSKSVVETIDLNDPEHPIDAVRFINTCESLNMTPGELVAWALENVVDVKRK